MPVLSDTAALYRFDRNLLDSSPNGAHLGVLAGVARYSELIPGYSSLMMRNTDRIRALGPNSCAITGDMTVEMIVNAGIGTNTNRPIYYWNDVAGTAVPWAIETHHEDENLRWWQTARDGVTVQQYVLPGLAVPEMQPFCYVAATRKDMRIQFYFNGVPLGPLSPPIGLPGVGAGSRLTFGGPSHAFMDFGDVRISNTAHSASDILAIYNLTMAPLFGVRT